MAIKTYSIGRDLNCDIVINDTTDVISRRHALLTVTPSGKMTLVDQSSNGTYVNGIRISPNVPVPVTRKDVVSLAHVAKLDWNMVPKSNQGIKYLFLFVAVIAVACAIVFGIKTLKGNSSESSDSSAQVTDSITMKQKEVARLDSIKEAARQDSVKKVSKKAGKDSTNVRKKSADTKKKDVSKPDNGKKHTDKTDNKEKENKKKSKRAIG